MSFSIICVHARLFSPQQLSIALLLMQVLPCQQHKKNYVYPPNAWTTGKMANCKRCLTINLAWKHSYILICFLFMCSAEFSSKIRNIVVHNAYICKRIGYKIYNICIWVLLDAVMYGYLYMSWRSSSFHTQALVGCPYLLSKKIYYYLLI